jgi:outer membrane biosynthesis protein TonB
MEKEQDEKKNKVVGITVAVGVHAILLLVFFFVVAWTIPNPPLPGGGGGIEMNFGTVDAGMGDIQTNTEEVSQETPTEEAVNEEVPEEAIVSEEKILTSEMESPHEVKAVEKDKKEKTQPVKEKKEVVEAKNTFPNRKSSESDGNKNVKGDQGSPQGNPDSRNMFPGGGKGTGNGTGNGDGPGSGDGIGPSMDMPGWAWDDKPSKVDPTSESGYVIFEFYIDEEGSVVSAKKIGGANFTPSEDNFYKKQLLETTFHLKDSRAKPAQKTKGVFRFDVRSR